MPEKNYGKRLCLLCEKEFEARHPAHVTCSADCARERRLILRRESDKRGRAKRKKYLLDLLAELDTAYSELEWANCQLEEEYKVHCKAIQIMAITHAKKVAEIELELKQASEERDAYRAAAEKQVARPEKPQPPQPVEKVAASACLPPLMECERMRLKAVQLPCGEHECCHKPSRCPRLGAIPDADIVLEPGEKLCKQCRQPFMPKSPAQKYCSKKCQEDAAKAKIYQLKK